MDRRSWPWKKKSSEKSATADANGRSLNNTVGEQHDKECVKMIKYVQISEESYAHLTESEELLKAANEKLSSALSEITSKDDLVKQHAKVAEEAVSGWEKAEAEALALKHQLENVMLQKLTSDEKASHLDGALKECMKQIRNVKEEGDRNLQEVILSKTKQWEKIKSDLDGKIVCLEQDLLMASAENSAVTRSLQERTSVLMKISEEKSRAEAEIEVLKGDIQLCEKEISSLKYELHISSKELEIRNEEKNMSLRSAEAVNKQHLEDVKKITKLENECQRLRVLVRKKLPGPAALAQMKQEVESLGRDYSEMKTRRSSARGSAPDFAFESFQQCHKENEFLTTRLIAMEEETKMLKEALSKRNSELQASRSMFAKTATKLHSLEENFRNHQKGSINFESSANESSNLSLTSMSEDGFEEVASCAHSWATRGPVSDGLQPKKEKHKEMPTNLGKKTGHLEEDLMDDFLEMERVACLSTDTAEAFDDKKSRETITEQNNIELRTVEVERETRDSTGYMNSMKLVTKEEIEKAVLKIRDVVALLHKDAIESWKMSPGFDELSEKIEDFSNSVKEILTQEESLDVFIVSLSTFLSEVQDLSSFLLGKYCDGDSSSDCIDKVALLENKVAQHEPHNAGKFLPSNPEADGLMGSGFDLIAVAEEARNCCTEEDFERLKLEKQNSDIELVRCMELLNQTKIKFVEMEGHLEELQEQLSSSRKANSLAETQLKCMAESYKSLETRCEGLKTEVNHLCTKVETLTSELDEERRIHQEDLAKCNDLQEKIMERNEKCVSCSNAEAYIDEKSEQEREIAAAAEKLAECQETIFLLSKQLNAMRPQLDFPDSSPVEGHWRSNTGFSDDEPSPNPIPPRGIPSPQRSDDARYPCMSPSDMESSTFPPRSPNGSKRQRPRSTSSPVATSSSVHGSMPTADKHGRGFSRFFSKSKSEHQ